MVGWIACARSEFSDQVTGLSEYTERVHFALQLNELVPKLQMQQQQLEATVDNAAGEQAVNSHSTTHSDGASRFW